MLAKPARFASLAFLILQIQAASAAWQWPSLREMCAQFLEGLRPVGDLSENEIRMDYNRRALRHGHARLVSNPNMLVRQESDREEDWLSTVSRVSIELTIAKSIPEWKERGYWYFQTVRDINLYTVNSSYPVRFGADTVVLMVGEYAAGEVLDVWNRVELFP